MSKALSNDQLSGQALLTGQIMGLLMRARAEGMTPNILDVHPVVDEHGNYEPFVDVTMPSGKYRLAVVHQTVIEEEP